MAFQHVAIEDAAAALRSSPIAFFALVVSLSLLLWRVWRFSVTPFLHPERPETYPYWVPWLGHIASFLRDSNATITLARLHFRNTRRPFALVLGGQNVYIITSARDASAVFKNAAQLSFDSYLKDMTTRFGVSPKTLEAAWKRHSEKKSKPTSAGGAHPGAVIAHAQFLSGPQMITLESDMLYRIHKRTYWRKIPSVAIVEDHAQEKIISLQNWVRHILIESITVAFFGEVILELEPNIVESLSQFDENSWKFVYQVPVAFSRDMLAAKGITQDALYRYFELPASERADACWMVQALEAEMKEVGGTTHDVCATFMLVYWVMNTNAWKAAFWLIAYILYDPSLKRSIENEVISLLEDTEPSPRELGSMLDASSSILAAYHETLRQTAASIAVRDVLEDCIVGGKRLQKGSRLIIPFGQLLQDENVFGPHPENFNIERFLRNPDLAKTPSFRPFGGGLTLCPGRFLAQKEILTITALLLGRFHVELKDEEQRLPDMDVNKPCLGIVPPRLGQDVLLRIQPRY